MSYSQRYQVLNDQFSIGNDCHLEGSDIDIRFYPFYSTYVSPSVNLYDGIIRENSSFMYPVFTSGKITQNEKAIVLLHGLNEHKWTKYLPWAEYLCRKTERPVVLFPIAFHMNRSPHVWSNPREMNCMMNLRRQRNGKDQFLSYANVALSERLSEQPSRFYNSGRQSLSDLTNLFRMIKEGKQPIFNEDTKIDIFAYSIGAFLSQITLMANPENLFSDTKLFMFCGGSIFNSIFGKSKSILDEAAFDKLLTYYTREFFKDSSSQINQDKALSAFYSMITPEWNKEERESFFKELGDRIGGVALKKDTVIPYDGIMKALGAEYTSSHVEKLDFEYDYSHQVPFPMTGKVDNSLVTQSFELVFSKAAEFLA